jgi:hypothetical protein
MPFTSSAAGEPSQAKQPSVPDPRMQPQRNKIDNSLGQHGKDETRRAPAPADEQDDDRDDQGGSTGHNPTVPAEPGQ